MKNKLLLLAFFALMSLKGFSQTTAYEVDELVQCMNEVFDLTVQNQSTLGTQPSSQFSVTYFTSQADAENNVNAIANPQVYIIASQWEQQIYIRVENNNDGTFDTTSFNIAVQEGINVTDFDDVVTCGFYILPPIQWPALYYTAPNMGGNQIPGGTVITTSQTIYIHAVSGTCNAESSFTVTINGDGPVISPLSPIAICDQNGDGFEAFNLEPVVDSIYQIAGVVAVTVHETPSDAEAGANAIPNISNYVSVSIPQVITVYVRVESSGCVSILPLELILYDCPTDNTFSGHVTFDADANGCDGNDPPAPGVWVYYSHNNSYQYAYTDSNGYYEFTNVPDGISYVSVQSWPLTVTASPAGIDLLFPNADPIDQDFCLTIPAPVQDVAVYLYPSTNAVAGFDASYVVVIQNPGTINTSGTVTVEYDATNLTFIPTAGITQSGNTLTINYANLGAFETQYFWFSATVAPPPALNFGDVITFTTTINPVTGDANPDNNVYVFDQTIWNSFDPNDITVREGEFITEDQADDYLHYMVRFQNTGNYQATNIKVEGLLDANLDWSTFEPVGASHNYQAYRDGNNIKFMFNSINLPDSTSNEAGSHGYIMYKIKPKATAAIGDTMSAQVGIYFDFNTAVLTNTATTTIQVLAAQVFDKDTFTIYPNPANGRVNLIVQDIAQATVSVTDVLGKTVLTSVINGTEASLDIAHLTTGMYFITLTAEGKQMMKKLVVK